MTRHHPTNSATNNQHAMYFNCNFCGGRIEGEEAWIGLESECPYCNKKITVPAPEAIQFPPGPSPISGEWAKDGPPATIDGGQGVSRNSQDTETNRNSGLPTEGVAVLLDHPRMDWTEDLAARIGRLPKTLVWGSIVGVVVLLAFCIVHGLRETKRRSISHNYKASSTQRSSYSFGSTQQEKDNAPGLTEEIMRKSGMSREAVLRERRQIEHMLNYPEDATPEAIRERERKESRQRAYGY